MKENKKKIIKIVGIILLFFIILKIITYQSTEEKATNYVKGLGYTNEGKSSIYSKLISDNTLEEFNQKVSNEEDAEYEENYFYADQYQFIKKKMEYDDGINTTQIYTYDYQEEKITYNYRITLKESVVIFEGDYDIDTEDFTCKNTYYYNFDIYEEDGEICDKIQYDIKDFAYESLTFITNADLLKSMKK